MDKISVQEYADKIVAAEYRQPLKTLSECLDVHGWQHVDKPECCGDAVRIKSLFGVVHFVECCVCGRFFDQCDQP